MRNCTESIPGENPVFAPGLTRRLSKFATGIECGDAEHLKAFAHTREGTG